MNATYKVWTGSSWSERHGGIDTGFDPIIDSPYTPISFIDGAGVQFDVQTSADDPMLDVLVDRPAAGGSSTSLSPLAPTNHGQNGHDSSMAENGPQTMSALSLPEPSVHSQTGNRGHSEGGPIEGDGMDSEGRSAR